MGTEQFLALLGAVVGLVGVLIGILLTFRASRLAREHERVISRSSQFAAKQLELLLMDGFDRTGPEPKTAEVRRPDGSTVEFGFDPDNADSIREFLRRVRQVHGDQVIAVH